MLRALAFSLLAASCAPAAPLVCNGSEKLCDRRYDEVAYPTTHNSMADDADGFIAFDQHNPMDEQLADGIRAMMLDLHRDMDGTGVWLCHGQCAWGKTSLADGLAVFKTFMDAHPDEVLTIQFEPYVPATDVAKVFADAGMLKYVVTHDASKPWPTLREMVTSGRRLVVFYEEDHDTDESGAPAWYLPLFANSFETPFAASTKDDLKCELGRGALGHSLFTLNHFLTQITGTPDLAETVNHDPYLVDRAKECEKTFDHIPNFVAVDFYDIGDLFAAVRALNGV